MCVCVSLCVSVCLCVVNMRFGISAPAAITAYAANSVCLFVSCSIFTQISLLGFFSGFS